MLRIRSLSKYYGAHAAVNDVSLEVGQGELVTLLGPSGCGKSTTLRCLAGLEIPDSGEVWLQDRLLAAPARRVQVPPEQRRVGMVFQSYALWPHMSVLENVSYPLRSQKRPRQEVIKRARDALELVGLSGYEGSQPGNISGGQQQRVALARALASECNLLLFDEPLSNLDVHLREQMRSEIRDLQARLRITTIYVTHDQSEALAISDRVAIMQDGAIVQVGTPREVFEQPATEFAATFLGKVNLLQAAATGKREADLREQFRLAGGGEVHVRTAGAGGPSAEGTAVRVGLRAELIRLSRNAPAAEKNVWKARVERAVFFGDGIEYMIAIPVGRLRVRTPPYDQFRIGEEVFASIAPEHCFIVGATPQPARQEEMSR